MVSDPGDLMVWMVPLNVYIIEMILVLEFVMICMMELEVIWIKKLVLMWIMKLIMVFIMGLVMGWIVELVLIFGSWNQSSAIHED